MQQALFSIQKVFSLEQEKWLQVILLSLVNQEVTQASDTSFFQGGVNFTKKIARRSSYYQTIVYVSVNLPSNSHVWKQCLMAQLIQRDQRGKRQWCIWRGWGWRSIYRPLAALLVPPRPR